MEEEDKEKLEPIDKLEQAFGFCDVCGRIYNSYQKYINCWYSHEDEYRIVAHNNLKIKDKSWYSSSPQLDLTTLQTD